MGSAATKIQFLLRVMGVGAEGRGLEPLTTDEPYVRDNVVTACEALKLKLIRLVADRDGFGFVLRITPGGKHLVEGRVEEAAAAIDSGSTLTRLWGDEPVGAIASRIYPGGPSLPISSAAVRTWAPEVLRGIATGSFVVEYGFIRAVERKAQALAPASERGAPVRGAASGKAAAPPSARLRGHPQGGALRLSRKG